MSELKKLKPKFLGEGDENQYGDLKYWEQRRDYWASCGHRYSAEALGYQMLIDGRAKQIGDGKIEYETED